MEIEVELMLTVRVRNGDKKYDKVINDEGSIIVGNILHPKWIRHFWAKGRRGEYFKS